MTDPHHESGTCPMDECQCRDWPPVECPKCGVVTIGFTPDDWREHFHQECDRLGGLYCFVAESPEEKKE